jgi:hypothetical protein
MKRLVDEGGEASAFERELLASAAADRMSPAARAAVVSAATAGGIVAANVATVALRSSKLWSLLGTKWGVFGLMAAIAAAGSASVVVAGRAARSPRGAIDDTSGRAPTGKRELVVATPAPDDAPPALEAPASPGGSADPSAVTAGEPAGQVGNPIAGSALTSPPAHAHARGLASTPAPVPVRASASASASTTVDAERLRTLGEQARLIEAARTALRQGDAAGALARLDEFDRLYPGDALAEEATVARIEALTVVDPVAARALASAYVASHPNGAYARRVSRLLSRLDATRPGP